MVVLKKIIKNKKGINIVTFIYVFKEKKEER